MTAYREISPPDELRSFVECFWFRDSSGPCESHRVLPDGCADIVLNFGDRWEREDERGRFNNNCAAYAVGVMTRPVIIHTTGRSDFLGVRFRPGKAQAFLKMPMADLTDRDVGLKEIFGPLAVSLVDQIAGMSSMNRVSTMAEFLKKRLANAIQPDARVRFAVEAIIHSNGSVSISDLCSSTRVTRQHLARLFQEHVGIGPKLLCRVFRFRSVLHSLKRNTKPDWADQAARLGYFDQPHLILDFKEFAGMTPGDYFK